MGGEGRLEIDIIPASGLSDRAFFREGTSLTPFDWGVKRFGTTLGFLLFLSPPAIPGACPAPGGAGPWPPLDRGITPFGPGCPDGGGSGLPKGGGSGDPDLPESSNTNFCFIRRSKESRSPSGDKPFRLAISRKTFVSNCSRSNSA